MLKNYKLQHAIKLSSKITVYVPATLGVNKAINNSQYVDKTAKMLSECFGGSTSSKALGYWMSSELGLIKEKTSLVFAYCDTSALEENINKVIDFIEALKVEMTQEAIALEINGEMYFI